MSSLEDTFEILEHGKPDVSHLWVLGCGVYVFLPEDVCLNKLAPHAELMTFISLADGVKGYIFMRSPNNVIFTAAQALFDETLYPKCPDMCHPGYTPVGIPDDQQGEHNTPLGDENGDNRGGDITDLWVPPPPMGPYPGGAPQGQHPNRGDLTPFPREHPSPFSDNFFGPRTPSPPPSPEQREVRWEHSLPATPFQRNPPQQVVRAPQIPFRQPPLQGGEPPWRLERIRQPVFHPDNVYGNQNPADIFQQPDNAIPKSWRWP